MLTIVIADDELPIREWLKYCLRDHEDRFEILGMASDGLAAYDLIRQHRPDLVITDIRMGQMSGLALMEQARQILPETDFVILTNHADFAYARQAISCGAKEYILKSELRSSELLDILTDIEAERKSARSARTVEPRGRFAKESMTEAAELSAVGHESIERALEYVHKHYSENLSLADVAHYVYRSPAYFSRLFKEVTKENFSAYLTQYRLLKAKALLEGSDLRITDISERVGYQNPSYFSRLYKKHMGYTPEDVRRRARRRG